MARAGRKRKLKPREPSGRIKKAYRDPVVWTLPPIEQIDMRTAILGSRTAKGEIAEPFTHIRPLLTDEQVAAAERFQRHWARSKVIGGPAGPSCILGDQQALGAISSAYAGHDENEAYYRAAYSNARASMMPKPRFTVELITGSRRPMFAGGDHILWFQTHISRHLSSYKQGLDQLSKHYGFDKVAKSGVWIADGA